MLECFKSKSMSPCSRAQTRASGAIQKQSRERLEMVKTTIKMN